VLISKDNCILIWVDNEVWEVQCSRYMQHGRKLKTFKLKQKKSSEENLGD